MSGWAVGIVIPARNEEKLVARCLSSVMAAVDASEAEHAWLVLVADGCTDGTAEIARRIFGSRGVVIECDAGSAGAARRIGTEFILQASASVPRSQLWLANTDADSVVPKDWIHRQLETADRGTLAIAGIVNVDSFAGHGAHGVETFRQHYVTHDDGTHPHVHGANLGMRADVCLDAGGWTDIRVGEDHCLWQRVRERGWPVLATTASVVTTSGRLQGRARGGFADTLRGRLSLGPNERPA